jgi:hypothetical protein
MLASICPPALLYFILSILGIIVMVLTKFRLVSIIVQICFIILWTWFLNFLCGSGYSIISWILVLLPVIISLLLILFSFKVLNDLQKDGTISSSEKDSVYKSILYGHKL